MDRIKGKHWVFISGFVTITLVSTYNTEIAMEMIKLLFLTGVGIALFGRS